MGLVDWKVMVLPFAQAWFTFEAFEVNVAIAINLANDAVAVIEVPLSERSTKTILIKAESVK